jgi:hypothetical protein
MHQNPYRPRGIDQAQPNLGRKCLFAVVWFTALIVTMGFSGYAVMLLPAVALLTVLFSRETDTFGLLLCLLLPFSFSYFYQAGEVPLIIPIVRFLLLLTIFIAYMKGRLADFEYQATFIWFSLFIMVAAYGSLKYSIYRDISLAKVAFCGLFLGGLLLTARVRSGFPHVALGVIAAIGFLSLLFYLIKPEVGYAFVLDPNAGKSAAGKFSGIMNHPQLLAALLAVNMPLMLHVFISRNGTASKLGFAAFVTSLLLIAVSSSRTGMLAAVIGCAFTLYFHQVHATNPAMKRRSQFVTFGIFLALCVGLIFAVDQMRIFVFKTEDIEGGLSLSGRDRIIGASWEGFLANPVFGNGFQVPSDFTEHGAATFGVSSEATTVEKCFFLTMLLEEVGILGTMLFLAVLGSLLAHWLRKGSYVAVSAMMAFLVINTGESCILSPSSIGGLCWLSIFATHNLRLLPEPWNS